MLVNSTTCTFARKAWLVAAGLLTTFTAAAQFPRNESFTGGSAPGFTFGGSGTNSSGTPNQAALTGGYLRLTDDAQQTTGFAVDSRDNAFPTSQGFSISFEFFSYGGTGADGFSMFLFDGETTNFAIGGAGGSLGYANYAYSGLTSAGATNGYLGIGFDEFGNFVTNNDGRQGSSSSTIPNSVTVRGKSANGYDLLGNSGTLSPALSVGTARAQAGSADYRRAFVDVKPANGSYLVTVRLQRGSTVSTVIDRLQAPAGIPNLLRIGFAAATGQSTNFHEIRGLQVVLPTQANDDITSTAYNAPATLNLLNNDLAPGSSLDPTTVDLDPSTIAVDNTVRTAQGTFTVNTSGVLTFTPSGTFAGLASIPYTVRDILGTLSNQATATIEVRGADVATAVTGPATALPGAR